MCVCSTYVFENGHRCPASVCVPQSQQAMSNLADCRSHCSELEKENAVLREHCEQLQGLCDELLGELTRRREAETKEDELRGTKSAVHVHVPVHLPATVSVPVLVHALVLVHIHQLSRN